jgi:hypothetical protein
LTLLITSFILSISRKFLIAYWSTFIIPTSDSCQYRFLLIVFSHSFVVFWFLGLQWIFFLTEFGGIIDFMLWESGSYLIFFLSNQSLLKNSTKARWVQVVQNINFLFSPIEPEELVYGCLLIYG